MSIILLPLVCFGMIAVCLCFVVLMPTVGQTVAVLFGAYAGEFAYAKANKVDSGSKFINPNDIPELQTVPEPTVQDQSDAQTHRYEYG